MKTIIAGILILAVCPTASRADTGKVLDDPITFQLATVFSSASYQGTGDPLTSRAGGVLSRIEGSLRRGFGAPGTSPGFRIEDWWTLDFGVGWVDPVNCGRVGNPCDKGPWVHFRLAAALRPGYVVNDQLELFSRLGYMTGTGNNTWNAGFQSGGYDTLFATAGAHVESVLVEAGVGTHGYLLGRIAYRARSGLFSWFGLRIDRNGTIQNGNDSGELLISLTAGSN